MSSGSLGFGTLTFVATSGVLTYQITNGDLVQAACVPFAGYVVSKTGEYYRSNTVHEIGSAIILASIITIPGVATGSAVNAALGNTLISKVISKIAGFGVTYKVFIAVIDSACQSAVRAVR